MSANVKNILSYLHEPIQCVNLFLLETDSYLRYFNTLQKKEMSDDEIMEDMREQVIIVGDKPSENDVYCFNYDGILIGKNIQITESHLPIGDTTYRKPNPNVQFRQIKNLNRDNGDKTTFDYTVIQAIKTDNTAFNLFEIEDLWRYPVIKFWINEKSFSALKSFNAFVSHYVYMAKA